MHKTTLVLDTRKLQKVRRALGTRSIRDTVDRAFDEVLFLEARRRLIERLSTMKGLDLARPEVMKKAWL